VADESFVVTEHAIEVALWSDGDAQGRYWAAIPIVEDHVTSTQPILVRSINPWLLYKTAADLLKSNRKND
jgi:hypothetical protein